MMIDEDYYTTAYKNIESMRQRVVLSKMADGKELAEGLSEVKLPADTKIVISKPAKEMSI